MAKLLVQKKGGEFTAYELNAGTVTVGRHPENTIELQDASVSSHHAEIVAANGSYTLRDLHSSNGTTLNGASVDEATIKSGDVIRFAGIECRFSEESQKSLPQEAARGVASQSVSTEPYSGGAVGLSPKARRRPEVAAAIGIAALLLISGGVWIIRAYYGAAQAQAQAKMKPAVGASVAAAPIAAQKEADKAAKESEPTNDQKAEGNMGKSTNAEKRAEIGILPPATEIQAARAKAFQAGSTFFIWRNDQNPVKGHNEAFSGGKIEFDLSFDLNPAKAWEPFCTEIYYQMGLNGRMTQTISVTQMYIEPTKKTGHLPISLSLVPPGDPLTTSRTTGKGVLSIHLMNEKDYETHHKAPPISNILTVPMTFDE